MVKRYAEFILRHKWRAVFACELALVFIGSGVRRLTFISDYRVFFGAESPQLLAFERLQDTYTRNDNAMFVLVPESGDVFTRETLAAVAWPSRATWST